MRRAASLLVVLVLVGVAGAVGWRVGRRDSVTSDVDPPVPPTVVVERGTVAEVVFASGSIRYPVLATLRADYGVVTAVAEAGSILSEGDSPLEIELRPMLLLVGEKPMFRVLSIGSRGEDVHQLQVALVRLGYLTGEPDGEFGPATRAAWHAFQEYMGVEPLDQVLTTDIAFVSTLPARLGEVSVGVGESAAGHLLTLTEPDPEIVAELPSGTAPGVAEGTPAELIWGESQSMAATVARVESEAELDIAVLSPESPELLPASFRVRLLLTLGADEGLVVPLSAVSTDANGTTHVTVWDSASRERRRVEVVIVSSSRVDAQISGAIEEGDEVVIGT